MPTRSMKRDPPEPWEGKKLGYRPALDGIRALAVLGVLAYHGGTPVNGGFIGVDVFFVLSGFLITTLLIQEWNANGSIGLRAFYGRRARRLLPALVATVVLVGLIYAADRGIDQGVGFFPAAAGVLFYVGNWINAFNGDKALGLLNHAWSLAIEEQFYLLWPLLLLLALRRLWTPRRLVLAILALAALSTINRALLWFLGFGTNIYFRSDARADELLIGCALAGIFSTREGRERIRRIFSPIVVPVGAAAVLLFFAVWLDWTSGFFYVGGLTIVTLCSALVIGHVLSASASPVTRLLATRPMVWIGERSYGLYLYHVPVFFGLLNHLPKHMVRPFPATFIIEMAVTFLIAAISYRYLESYFLRHKRYPHSSRSRSPRDGSVEHTTPLGAVPPTAGP